MNAPLQLKADYDPQVNAAQGMLGELLAQVSDPEQRAKILELVGRLYSIGPQTNVSALLAEVNTVAIVARDKASTNENLRRIVNEYILEQQQAAQLNARIAWMGYITSEEFIEENTTYSVTNHTGIYDTNGILRDELLITDAEAQQHGYASTAAYAKSLNWRDGNGASLVVENNTDNVITGADGVDIPPRGYYTMNNGVPTIIYREQDRLSVEAREANAEMQRVAVDPDLTAQERDTQMGVIQLRTARILVAAGASQESIQSSLREFGIRTMSGSEITQSLGIQSFSIGAGVPTPEPAPPPVEVQMINLDFDGIDNGRNRVSEADKAQLADSMDLNNDGRLTDTEVLEFTRLQQNQGVDLAAIARSLNAAGVAVGDGSAKEIAEGLGRYIPTPTQQASTNDRGAALG